MGLKRWLLCEKNSYKSVRRSKLESHKLEDMLTDIETNFSDRHLNNMEDEIEFFVLTPPLSP